MRARFKARVFARIVLLVLAHCHAAPPAQSLELSVDDIPASMNGSVPVVDLSGASDTFRLSLPRAGFTVDVWPDPPAAHVDALYSDVAPNKNLAPRLQASATGWQLTIADSDALPAGAVTFTARAGDHSAALAVNLIDKTADNDPFHLPDTWLVVFSRDDCAVQRRSPLFGVESTPGANGVPDFAEDLLVLGLGSSAPLPAAATLTNGTDIGSNAIVLGRVERAIIEEIRRLFLQNADGTRGKDAIALSVLREGDAGAPAPADFVQQTLTAADSQRGFSMIGVGGGDLARPYLGLSQRLDIGNRNSDANVGPDHGVFVSKAIAYVADAVAADPAGAALLRQFLGELIPELGSGGRAIGEDPADVDILAPGFDPNGASPAVAARAAKLQTVVALLGQLLGALTAHEIGHGLGLVADGPPPRGLFGGERNASFVNADRTTPGHIALLGGFEVMEAGPGSAPNAVLDLARYLGQPSFNPLSRAYLQGRLLISVP